MLVAAGGLAAEAERRTAQVRLAAQVAAVAAGDRRPRTLSAAAPTMPVETTAGSPWHAAGVSGCAALPLLAASLDLDVLVCLTTRDGGLPATVPDVLTEVAERAGYAVTHWRAHEALAVTAERYELVVDAAGLAVWDGDFERDTGRWSEPFKQLLDVQDDEPHSLATLFKRVHPDDLPALRRRVEQALDPAGDGHYHAEFRVVHGDGSVRWLEDRGRVYFAGAGSMRRAARAVGMAIDLTARRQAENAMRRHEARQTFLLTLGDTLRTLEDSRSIVVCAAELFARQLGVAAAGFSWLDPNGDDAEILGAWGDGTVALLPTGTRYRLSDFGPGWGPALRDGREVFSADLQEDPRSGEAGAAASAQFRGRSASTVPLRSLGRTIGWLWTAHSAPRTWSADDRSLHRDVAERVFAKFERAQARKADADSRAALQAFYDSSPLLTGVAAVEGDTILAVESNAATARFFDLEGGRQVVGRSGDELGAQAAGAAWLALYRQALALGAAVRFEHEQWSPRGPRWLAGTVAPIGHDDSGRPRFSFVVEDVTETKRVQQALRRHEAKQSFLLSISDALRELGSADDILLESACRLGRHFGASRAGYAEDCGDGEHCSAGRAYTNGVRAIEGLHRYDDYGVGRRQHYEAGLSHVLRDIARDDAVSPQQKQLYAALGGVAASVVAPVLHDGRLRALLYVHFDTPRPFDGDEIAVIEAVAQRTWEAVVRARAEAQLRQAHAALEDRVRDRTAALEREVAQRRAAQEELAGSQAALRQRAAELEQRTAQLSRLATELTVSEQHAREQMARLLHDHLQQHLVSASLQLDALGDGSGTAGAVSSALRQARTAVGEAIDAARLLAVDLYPPALRDGGLPEAVVWLGNGMARRHGLPVEVVADPDADTSDRELRTLLFECTRELLLNAVKHARASLLRVTLAAADDGTLRIEVSDNGSGFDPRAVLAERSIGTGLGLSSVRERLELKGGRLEIDSRVGAGARLTIAAPARRASDRSSAEVRAPAAAAAASAPPLRILLADDHAAVRAGLRALLGARPALQIVGEAVDGAEAIALAAVLQPDVVLMDVRMPNVDGIAATRRLRVTQPQVRVIGLSMQERTGARHPIEEAGAEAYFMKGDEVSALIDYLVALHAARADGLPPAVG